MTKRDTERRKHPRSRRGLKSKAAKADSGLINHVENISGSGVLCSMPKPVAEMTKMRIVLELPAPVEREVEAEGIVVRCDAADRKGTEFSVAILYTNVSDADRDAIEAYVSHDLAQAEDA